MPRIYGKPYFHPQTIQGGGQNTPAPTIAPTPAGAAGGPDLEPNQRPLGDAPRLINAEYEGIMAPGPGGQGPTPPPSTPVNQQFMRNNDRPPAAAPAVAPANPNAPPQPQPQAQPANAPPTPDSNPLIRFNTNLPTATGKAPAQPAADPNAPTDAQPAAQPAADPNAPTGAQPANDEYTFTGNPTDADNPLVVDGKWLGKYDTPDAALAGVNALGGKMRQLTGTINTHEQTITELRATQATLTAEAAPLDLVALEAEFIETQGQFTPDTRSLLEGKLGGDPAIVDALVNVYTQKIVGRYEKFNQLSDGKWDDLYQWTGNILTNHPEHRDHAELNQIATTINDQSQPEHMHTAAVMRLNEIAGNYPPEGALQQGATSTMEGGFATFAEFTQACANEPTAPGPALDKHKAWLDQMIKATPFLKGHLNRPDAGFE